MFAAVGRLLASMHPRSKAQCRSLYKWEASFYDNFDYRVVAARRLANGRWHIALTRWHGPSFIDLRRERVGWRIVAGGW